MSIYVKFKNDIDIVSFNMYNVYIYVDADLKIISNNMEMIKKFKEKLPEEFEMPRLLPYF